MTKDLLTRLNEGPVLCAEGYLFAMERRGYLQAGAFVPEVVQSAQLMLGILSITTLIAGILIYRRQ